jgi:aerobic carbon-monoxide dehydrogenase medium subunit
MKPPRFKYVRVASVDEAIAALGQWRGEARLLSGGQSLVPLLNVRLARPDAVIDVNRIPRLDRIEERNGTVAIGALTRHAGLEWSPVVGASLPLLTEAIRHVGDRQIRARGTLGGSLAHADPTAELCVASLALGATIHVRGAAGSRDIPAAELFQGPYATALADGEMITGATFPRRPGAVSAFTEVSRRHGDFAVVSVAVVGVPGPGETWESLRIALGGVSDRPILVERAGALAAGNELTADLVAAIAQACVDASRPPTDIRASAGYRRHLIPIQVERAIATLKSRRAADLR